MIYVPDLTNYKCFVVRNDSTIRAYKQTPRNNADIELKDVNDKTCVDYAVENSYQELATFLQYTSLKKTIDKEGVVNPSKGKKVSKV